MIKIEKYIEVIRKILPLLDTMEEAILHIQKQLSELRYEETFTMLQDALEGITSIESAIEPMLPKLVENNIERLSLMLKENMNKAISYYGQGKEIDLDMQVNEEILPAFKELKAALESVLTPYIIS